MSDDDRHEELETIVSWFLFVVTVVAGICLGTHFTYVERAPEVIPVVPRPIAELQAELAQERQAREEALDRLTALMSSRIRDGNSDIVDLSDPNRPEKIGEMFSDLYDNQWTDAYSVLDGQFHNNERQVIEFLSGILKICFEACREYAENELEHLRDVVKQLETDVSTKHTRLSDDLMQRIKEERKLSGTDQSLEYDKISELKRYFSTERLDLRLLEQTEVKVYILECLRISRLMVIQDPPMTLLFQPETNIKDHYRAYTHKGTQIDIVVWPALYLKEGGTLVKQGVIKFHK